MSTELKGGIKDQEIDDVTYDAETDEICFHYHTVIRHKLQTLLNEQQLSQLNLNKINEKIKLALQAKKQKGDKNG